MKKNLSFKISGKSTIFLTIILAMLKVFGLIELSWWIVFLPFIFFVSSALLIFCFLIALAIFKNIDDQEYT